MDTEMKNIMSKIEENKRTGFSIIELFFCFIDFIYGFIYCIMSRNSLQILINILVIILLDIIDRIFQIFFFTINLNIKSLIIFILSLSQFYYIICFIINILSNMDIDNCQKQRHKIILTSFFGLIVFPYEEIIKNTKLNYYRFIFIIIIICYTNYFIRKKMDEYINNIYEKINENLFLYGIIYFIPYFIYFSSFALCFLEFTKIFLFDELYKSYFLFASIIFKEVIKNCTFIFLGGILYLFAFDLEFKNSNINNITNINNKSVYIK